MTRQLILTKAVVEAFVEEGNLTERQAYLIRSRAKGYTIARQAEELHLSVDQVNKDIALLKRIYDATQSSSEVLPPRKKNKHDLFRILLY